jgi:hypothetical protein
MVEGQLRENFFAFRCQREKDLAAIVLCAGAMDEPAGFEPVY